MRNQRGLVFSSRKGFTFTITLLLIAITVFFGYHRKHSSSQTQIEFCRPAYACVASCSEADRKSGKDCCPPPSQITKESRAGKKAEKKEAEKKDAGQ